MLDRADPQLRISIEDAREDHRAQRVAHPVVGGGTARAGELAEVHRELAAGDAAAWRADVQQQWEPQVLRGPPQAVVDRMTIRAVGQRRDGDEGADQPEPGAALELQRRLLDIVHVEHGDALEPIGKGLAEVGDPVVVDAADGREHGAVGDAVPEETLARLQARAPHAVHLVLLDHRLGIVGAEPDVFPRAEEIDLRRILEPLSGLHHGAQGAGLLTVDEPGVEFAARGRLQPRQTRGPLPEFWLDPGRVEVRRLDDVRIGRDELVRQHRNSPSRSGRKPVVRRAVVPQDLALALLGDRQSQK